MPDDQNIAIAGAGIAGLASALALTQQEGRHGAGGDRARIKLFERRKHFSNEGAGIQLGPNAIRALKALDVWEGLKPAVFEPDRIVFRDGLSGRRLAHLPLGRPFQQRFGEAYALTRRSDLQQALLDKVAVNSQITLKTGTAVTGITADGAVMLDHETRCRAAFCLAADGISSSLRKTVTDQAGPHNTGTVIYRSILDAGALPGDIDADCVGLWFYPGGHVVNYPLGDGSRINLVATLTGNASHAGWSNKVDAAAVKEGFSSASPVLQELLARAGDWRCWTSRMQQPCRGWSNARFGIIGDAAHASLPTLAQGAAMALEDAVCLGRLWRKNRDMPSAMREFETARFARTARLIKVSQRLSQIYHWPAPLSFLRNGLLATMPVAAGYRQLAWLYQYGQS